MTEAEEWRQYSAELRQVAARAEDAERQRKLLDLAERWAQFAEELRGASANQPAPSQPGVTLVSE